MALANLNIYYTWKNINSECSNNKFNILAPTQNDTFDLPDGPYSIADIQDYFEFIIKKHETLAKNPPVQIYPNKLKNRTVFKIKTGYKLELLTPETMTCLEAQKKLYQNQNLLKLYQCTVFQSKMITSTHQRFYLFLSQINNFVS